MTTLPNISAPNICGASCQLREPVRGLFGRALATSQLWRGRSARFLSPASCAWRVPVQHRWMGHAGQGGPHCSHVQEEEEEEEEDMKMMIELAVRVLGPSMRNYS